MADDEVARLDALRSFGILDTPPERTFDDLARLTSYVCGTPIAFIGFMDAERLWFKSRVGWEALEVPREMSFCTHTIQQADALVVSDTLADRDRLASCPLATREGIRFYAGISLMSSEGHAVGTLCAMDWIPRGLTACQVDSMRKIARQVVSLLEMRRMKTKPLPTAAIEQGGGSGMQPPRAQGFSFWRDMSEQQRANDALRRREHRLEGIIESAMDAIITIDGHQRIVMFNKAAEQIFRCTAADAIGELLDKFIPERFRSGHRKHVQTFGETGITARSNHSPGMLFGLRADGEEFAMEATISQAEAEGEKFFTVIVRDISARLRMEMELRQAHKMEAVGQLAGGIAHEFNNFLGVILGYSDLLSEEAGANEKLCRYVTEINSATQHAASLTRQLLTFSRKKVLEPRVLDLNACIWEGHKLLRRLVPANIDVVLVLAPPTGKVKADEGQIQQILINLLVNARDAMPDGGRVVIETSNVELDAAYVGQYVGLQPGGYVLLSITDSGTGMTAETQSHLFEPFFTTKGPGKGTGLGLSTVHGIVKHGGGHISVESGVGKGTTFRIYLPRIQETGEESVPPVRPVGQTGPATILVVEDESSLRRLICMSLEKRGHKVLTAKDGVDGLEIFRQHADQIQLVISDLVMPRMHGIELKQRIAALKPEVRFLFMSGYAEQTAEQQRAVLEGCAFLEKPFLLEQLANKVNSVLAGEAAA